MPPSAPTFIGLDDQGNILQWKDTGGAGENEGSGEDILTRMKDRNLRDLVYLINKPPRWNEQVGAYVLNFNGRVTMASVKNFQLVDPDEQNAVVLQVRKTSRLGSSVKAPPFMLLATAVLPVRSHNLVLTFLSLPYTVLLQFGRVGKDEFTMDLQHPISPFQAFAVTLSSFDSKIACD